jgi:putative ATP-dependent endonuclease of OLD family
VLLIGDNNTGKSTVLEAIDLVLGPDRISRRPPVDEHDFYLGKYLPERSRKTSAEASQPTTSTHDESRSSGYSDGDVNASKIRIDVTVTNLSDEQRARFGEDYIEWWDTKKSGLYTDSDPAGLDLDEITPAVRITFVGQYDSEEDDFEGNTYFTRSLSESDRPEYFTKKNKQYCGFLYLRSLRTGSRALSLEHGSLLDIILRLKEVRPQMWESTIASVSSFNVASDPVFGISGVLESINASLKKYVPREWGVEPHLKVSKLTREDLRKVVTAFIGDAFANRRG